MIVVKRWFGWQRRISTFPFLTMVMMTCIMRLKPPTATAISFPLLSSMMMTATNAGERLKQIRALSQLAMTATTTTTTTLQPSNGYVFQKELEVKKSVFIARATHVKSFKEAMIFLEKVQDLKASHNCWAVTLADDLTTPSRCSDDGEPASTAGKPILAALEGDNIVNTMIVVTRYFGGTELGKGGLIRAYGGVARDCVREAEKVAIIQTQKFKVQCNINDIGKVYQAIDHTNKRSNPRISVHKLDEKYESDGVNLKLRIDADVLEDFEKKVKSLSHLIETERLGCGGTTSE